MHTLLLPSVPYFSSPTSFPPFRGTNKGGPKTTSFPPGPFLSPSLPPSLFIPSQPSALWLLAWQWGVRYLIGLWSPQQRSHAKRHDAWPSVRLLMPLLLHMCVVPRHTGHTSSSPSPRSKSTIYHTGISDSLARGKPRRTRPAEHPSYLDWPASSSVASPAPGQTSSPHRHLGRPRRVRCPHSFTYTTHHFSSLHTLSNTANRMRSSLATSALLLAVAAVAAALSRSLSAEVPTSIASTSERT